jgi:hypothetical protein
MIFKVAQNSEKAKINRRKLFQTLVHLFPKDRSV